jgi:hypothetical protein
MPGGRQARRAISALVRLRHPRLMRRFADKLGFWPDPAFPRSYNEKLLWRKLFDHDPRFVVFSDKLAAKAHAAAACPDLAMARTLWAGRSPRDIPAALIEEDVVVKTNHGCGFNIFVADAGIDRRRIERRTGRWLRRSFGRHNHQWAYWKVPRRVFVEERLPLGGTDGATDLKLHVCGGRVVHGWATDKRTGRAITLDAAGRPLVARAAGYAADERVLPYDAALEARFAEAASFAGRLADGLDYMRCDFMVAGDRLFFGELTVYPASGYDRWDDPAIAEGLTRAWDLRRSAFFERAQGGPLGSYARLLEAWLDG